MKKLYTGILGVALVLCLTSATIIFSNHSQLGAQHRLCSRRAGDVSEY